MTTFKDLGLILGPWIYSDELTKEERIALFGFDPEAHPLAGKPGGFKRVVRITENEIELDKT